MRPRRRLEIDVTKSRIANAGGGGSLRLHTQVGCTLLAVSFAVTSSVPCVENELLLCSWMQ